MTLELLIAVAQLCMLPGSGAGIFVLKHEQLKCQQNYIKCVRNLARSLDEKISPNHLEACVVTRKSTE